MQRLMLWTVALATLTLVVPSAFAAKPKRTPEERFAKLDANSDKKLSKEEFVGKKTDEAKTKAEKRFTKLDKDQDDSLTFEEFNVTPKKKPE